MYNFQTLKEKNTDPISIFCIIKVKVLVWQVSQDNLGQFSGYSFRLNLAQVQ